MKPEITHVTINGAEDIVTADALHWVSERVRLTDRTWQCCDHPFSLIISGRIVGDRTVVFVQRTFSLVMYRINCSVTNWLYFLLAALINMRARPLFF